MPMSKKFDEYANISFKLTRGDAGFYYVTSPDIKGLFIAGKSPDEAFAEMPRVCRALLELHDAEPIAENKDHAALREWFGPQIDTTATIRK